MNERINSQASPCAETADIETSSPGYAARFAGPVGQWLLQVQEEITLAMLSGSPVKTVLEVGGGHGQLALPLVAAGFDLTVTGSAGSCRERIAALADAGRCAFTVADHLRLPFAAASFDAVLCFRLLTHCEKWPQVLGELCRVARQRVIIDYPTGRSLNAFTGAFFAAKKNVEKNTRPWRLFSHAEIARVFAANGFTVTCRQGQFFLPMVLHRLLKRPGLSRLLEGISRSLLLSRLWGSPVIVLAEPKKS